MSVFHNFILKQHPYPWNVYFGNVSIQKAEFDTEIRTQLLSCDPEGLITKADQLNLDIEKFNLIDKDNNKVTFIKHNTGDVIVNIRNSNNELLSVSQTKNLYFNNSNNLESNSSENNIILGIDSVLGTDPVSNNVSIGNNLSVQQIDDSVILGNQFNNLEAIDSSILISGQEQEVIQEANNSVIVSNIKQKADVLQNCVIVGGSSSLSSLASNQIVIGNVTSKGDNTTTIKAQNLHFPGLNTSSKSQILTIDQDDQVVLSDVVTPENQILTNSTSIYNKQHTGTITNSSIYSTNNLEDSVDQSSIMGSIAGIDLPTIFRSAIINPRVSSAWQQMSQFSNCVYINGAPAQKSLLQSGDRGGQIVINSTVGNGNNSLTINDPAFGSQFRVFINNLQQSTRGSSSQRMLIIHDNGQITTKSIPSSGGGGGSGTDSFISSIVGGVAGGLAGFFVSRAGGNTDPPDIQFPSDNSPLGLWIVVNYAGVKWYKVPNDAYGCSLGQNTLPRFDIYGNSALHNLSTINDQALFNTRFNLNYPDSLLCYSKNSQTADLTHRGTHFYTREFIWKLLISEAGERIWGKKLLAGLGLRLTNSNGSFNNKIIIDSPTGTGGSTLDLSTTGRHITIIRRTKNVSPLDVDWQYDPTKQAQSGTARQDHYIKEYIYDYRTKLLPTEDPDDYDLMCINRLDGTLRRSPLGSGNLLFDMPSYVSSLTEPLLLDDSDIIYGQTSIGDTPFKTSLSKLKNHLIGIPFRHDDPKDNFSLGEDSLALSFASGVQNSSFGINSLVANTSGRQNSSFGMNSMALNTTGIHNSSFGFNALSTNISGDRNNSIGSYSMRSNQTGTNNCVMGVDSLRLNESGSFNIAIGNSSQRNAVEREHNIAIGHEAMNNNVTGSYNTVLGSTSGATDMDSYNTLLGYSNSTAAGATRAIAIGDRMSSVPSNAIWIGNYASMNNTCIGGIWNNPTTIDYIVTIDSTNRLGRKTLSVYSKSQSDAKFRTVLDSYSKTQINNLLENYYTQFQSNNRYRLISDSYSKSQCDNKYRLISDSYTKTQTDNLLTPKLDALNMYSYVNGLQWKTPDMDTVFVTFNTANSTMRKSDLGGLINSLKTNYFDPDNYYTTAAIIALLLLKSDKASTYNKTEVDGMFITKNAVIVDGGNIMVRRDLFPQTGSSVSRLYITDVGNWGTRISNTVFPGNLEGTNKRTEIPPFINVDVKSNTIVGIGNHLDHHQRAVVDNVCLGVDNWTGSSLARAEDSENNITIGNANCYGVIHGKHNVVIGRSTFRYGTFPRVQSLMPTITNCIAIGVGTQENSRLDHTGSTPATVQNMIILGNSTHNTLICKGARLSGQTGSLSLYITPSGLIRPTTSSARYKNDIVEISDDDIDSFESLTPRSYLYKDQEEEGPDINYGFIAQETDEKMPVLCSYANGIPQSVKYNHVPALLAASNRRLRNRVANLESDNSTLKNEVSDLKTRLERLEALLLPTPN